MAARLHPTDVPKMIRATRHTLNRHALPLALLGGAGVAWHNWRMWQRDRAMLANLPPPPSIPPLNTWGALPLVSVLVAAWHEADLIEQHIQSFLALRYPHKELVLCAGGSDGTYQIAHRHASEQVIVLEQHPGEGKQRALTRSLPHIHGSIIYLTDADCLLNDAACERLLYALVVAGEQAATGSTHPLAQQQRHPFVVAQAASQHYAALRQPTYCDGLLGRNAALTRDLLLRSGGLHAPAPSGTDYVLAKHVLRTGARIRYLPDSQIATHYPTSIPAYIRQQRRWLRNLLLLGHRYHDPHYVRHALLTGTLGTLLLALPLLAVLLRGIGWAGWLVGWLAGVAARVRYIAVWRATHPTQDGARLSLAPVPVMLADWIAWHLALRDALVDWRRQQW